MGRYVIRGRHRSIEMQKIGLDADDGGRTKPSSPQKIKLTENSARFPPSMIASLIPSVCILYRRIAKPSQGQDGQSRSFVFPSSQPSPRTNCGYFGEKRFKTDQRMYTPEVKAEFTW